MRRGEWAIAILGGIAVLAYAFAAFCQVMAVMTR